MLMASRFAKLQDQLSQGLASIRGQKYSTVNQYGMAAANAATTSNENSRRMAYDREQNALRSMLDLRGQVSTENNQAANRQFQGNESQLSREFQAQQSELDRQYGDAQNAAKSAADFEHNKQIYERESALIAQRNAGGGGGGSARPAAAATPQSNTQDAIADLKAVFTNANEATAAIKEQMQELAAARVDIAALFNAANELGGRRAGTPDY